MRAWQQLKNVYHFGQAHWWRVYFGRPDRGMKIYGVTGTNGKTTTCYVLASILRKAYGKEKVGMLSTVGIWLGDKEEVNETKMTTTDSRVVYRYLRQMREGGVQHVVLEITSHALDQNRLAGMKLDGAVILNIEREHLDYHGSIREYARAKARIVDYLRPEASLVVNKKFLIFQPSPRLRPAGNLKFSRNFPSLRQRLRRAQQFSNVKVIEFTADQTKDVTTSLAGDFNKENVLAASLLAGAVEIDKDDVKRGVMDVKSVPGRMEWVGSRVLIDYAVTPGALDRLYEYVREETSGKVLAVLGAAGLRDRGKRPLMARAVARYADEIVLTREDPWTEDEEQIFSDLEKGLTGAAIPWQRIVDRKEAIKYALEKAGSNDVVVVTGKGAETGMGVGRKIMPWSDKKVTLELLKKL